MTRKTSSVAFAILFSAVAFAHIIWVPDEYPKIQDALDNAQFLDTVMVQPGTYEENLVWPHAPSLWLLGEYGPESTIIDGRNLTSVILCTTRTDTSTHIAGFTLTGGSASTGGGILISRSSATIENNVITGNHAEFTGGGIFGTRTNSRIVGNRIFGNSADRNGGGGMALLGHSYHHPLVEDNDIEDNEALFGGGIWIGSLPFTLTENRILDNWARTGGGIYVSSSDSGCITGCTIEDNHATLNGGGLACVLTQIEISENMLMENRADYYGGGMILMNRSSPSLVLNVLYRNEAYLGGGLVCIERSSPDLELNDIKENEAEIYGGVYVADSSDPVFHHNNIRGNGYGLWNEDGRLTLDAEENFFGDPSGPYHATLNPTGLGDTVSEYVDFDPWSGSPSIDEWPLSATRPSRVVSLRAWPNPSRGTVALSAGIPGDTKPEAPLLFRVFDALGRPAGILRSVRRQRDMVFALWDPVDRFGRTLPEGVYFARIEPYRRSIPLVRVR
jgi:hypothetical protein